MAAASSVLGCILISHSDPDWMQKGGKKSRLICKLELSKCHTLFQGYTGFVPRSRGLLGLGYPLITHNALNEFTDEVKEYKVRKSLPVTIYRDKTNYVDANLLYPNESGLVPHYTGHIPGEYRRNRFLTERALFVLK